MAQRPMLIPINPATHYDLFRSLYDSTLEWSRSSGANSVVNHESILMDPCAIWRMYVDGERVLGLCGFHFVNMIDRSADPLVAIIEEERRRGYGMAMARELVDFGFKQLNLHRMWTAALKGTPSRYLLDRMGFTHEATLKDARFKNGRYEDVLMYRLFREEYEQCQVSSEAGAVRSERRAG